LRGARTGKCGGADADATTTATTKATTAVVAATALIKTCRIKALRRGTVEVSIAASL
jgi:hypothetical protein